MALLAFDLFNRRGCIEHLRAKHGWEGDVIPPNACKTPCRRSLVLSRVLGNLSCRPNTDREMLGWLVFSFAGK